MPTLSVVKADLEYPEDRDAVTALIDGYARDPMGAGKPLDDEVRARLAEALETNPTTTVFLAEEDDEVVGAAVCFAGFSTFAAKKLLNIHDVVVRHDWRGRGIGRRLLEGVIDSAREMGYCKLTLEVNWSNARARDLYRDLGFGPVPTDVSGDAVLSLSRPL